MKKRREKKKKTKQKPNERIFANELKTFHLKKKERKKPGGRKTKSHEQVQI